MFHFQQGIESTPLFPIMKGEEEDRRSSPKPSSSQTAATAVKDEPEPEAGSSQAEASPQPGPSAGISDPSAGLKNEDE